MACVLRQRRGCRHQHGGNSAIVNGTFGTACGGAFAQVLFLATSSSIVIDIVGVSTLPAYAAASVS